MADPKGLDLVAFRMMLRTVQPMLVIVDTQARVTVGAEENSSKDMGVFVNVLDTLRRESSATMLIVHHEPRSGENLRGSVALEGAADTVIRTDKDGDTVKISNPKQKNAPQQSELVLTLYPVGESAVLFSDVPGTRHSLGPNEEKLLEVLAEFPGACAPATQWLEVSGLQKGSFYRSRNKLLRRGRVVEGKDGNSTTYRLPGSVGSPTTVHIKLFRPRASKEPIRTSSMPSARTS